MTNLERFTAAFIDALYFTDTGDEGQPDSDADIDPETLLNLEAHCRSFWANYGWAITSEVVADHFAARGHDPVEIAGHDFWFSANHHGVGFWEPGDWPEYYGDMLDKAAKSYGPFETYQGDDGLIYA